MDKVHRLLKKIRIVLWTSICLLLMLFPTACGKGITKEHPISNPSNAESYSTDTTIESETETRDADEEKYWIDACTLLTEDEVIGIFNRTIESVKMSDYRPAYCGCRYFFVEEKGKEQLFPPEIYVILDHMNITKDRFEVSREYLEPVDELGDDAFWDPELLVLWIKTNDSILTITPSTLPSYIINPEDRKAKTIELAKIAVERYNKLIGELR